MASSSTNSDPAELVASLFGVMTVPVLLVIIHGAVAGNIENFYSAPLCFLAGGIKIKRWLGSIISGVIASAVFVRVSVVHQVGHHIHQLYGLVRDLDGGVGVIVIIDFFVLNRRRQTYLTLYGSHERSRYGDVRWRSLVALLVGLVGTIGIRAPQRYRYSRARSPAPPRMNFSWLASIVFGGLTSGCCAAPSRILSTRLRWPPGMTVRSRP